MKKAEKMTTKKAEKPTKKPTKKPIKKSTKEAKKSAPKKETKTKKTPTTDIKKPLNKKKHKIYISYKLRLVFNCFVFVLLFAICLVFAAKSIDYRDPKVINYKENNQIDYKVKVKPNDFYETEYLNSNMIYVASLIDTINIDFDYKFTIDEKYSLDFEYRILGDLVISSTNGKTNYFQKQYVLLDTKHGQMDDKNYNIKETMKIDYDYYNHLANDFKTSYGVDTNSYLNVYLEVRKKSNNEQLKIDNKSSSSIKIPLSEKSVEIQFDAKDSVSNKQAVADEKMIFNSHIFIICIILFFISMIFMSKTNNLLGLLTKKKNPYDIYLKKILKEYDRLIVETTTGIDEKNSHIIKIDKFNELLDVRDNLKLPIMYYNVVSHQKCYFYIKKDNDVYLMVLKAIDMQK